MKDKLTIIVPLKGRPNYTIKFMERMSERNCPFKILIADGGKDIEIENLLSSHESYENLDYEYIRYPYDKTLTEYYQKMEDVSSRVDTPYVSIQDNDDWFEIEGMSECVSILENENYTSSRGALSNSTGDNIWSQYPDDIIGDTAVARVADQSKYFHSNWHSVMKSDVLKISMSFLNAASPSNFRFVEQINCYIPIVFGNGHRGDFPWMNHRRGERIQTEGGCLSSHFPDQQTWINSNYWTEDFNKMTEAVGVAISHVDGVSVYEAMEWFTTTYPHKLPHLTDLLTDRINYAKSLGYNKERIDKMKEIVHQYSV